jgi:hypothetical protein
LVKSAAKSFASGVKANLMEDPLVLVPFLVAFFLLEAAMASLINFSICLSILLASFCFFWICLANLLPSFFKIEINSFCSSNSFDSLVFASLF